MYTRTVICVHGTTHIYTKHGLLGYHSDLPFSCLCRLWSWHHETSNSSNCVGFVDILIEDDCHWTSPFVKSGRQAYTQHHIVVFGVADHHSKINPRSLKIGSQGLSWIAWIPSNQNP